MLLRLAPPGRVGEMFGLYGLVGKLSAVIGPIICGTIVARLLASRDRDAHPGDNRLALRAAGGRNLVLRGVPDGEPENEEAAVDALMEGMSR